MFKKFVRYIKVDFDIGVNLIAIGSTTWQTKNVTSVSVDEQVAKLGISKPSMQIAKPKRDFHLAILTVSIALAWIYASTFDERAVLVGLGLSLMLITFICVIAHYAHKNKMNKWSVENEKTIELKKVWSELQTSPPIFYSLYIDSSNGKGLALVSLDIEPVNKVKKAILESMQSVVSPDQRGHINIVDMGKESPDQMLDRYYKDRLADIA